MKPDIEKMHEVWDSVLTSSRSPSPLPKVNFDEIISSIFTMGPFYYYIIDFFDMSISNISPGFYKAHGLGLNEAKNLNDVLNLIHPDDIAFVSKAEKKALDSLYYNLAPAKILDYKFSYNLRFRTADGSYQLFNHQSLILTIDENNNFIKSLNIHTNISHITKKNNYTVSLIGLGENPSYMNIAIDENHDDLPHISPAETKVLGLMADGLSSKQIAEQLFISEHTVKHHRKNMLKKSGCTSSPALIKKAISEGWL